MKRIAACLMFLFCLCSHAQTSVYHHMSDSGATWCETYTYGLCPTTEVHVISMGTDTVIGQHAYHTLVANGYRFCGVSQNAYFSNEIRGAFREDTVTRRVYYVDFSWQPQEMLRYDFNWTIGDTVPGTYGPDAYISSVDSVLVGSDYRKRWWVNSAMFMDSGCIVEGIGSSFGFYMLDWQGVESFSHLYSYAESGADMWQPDSNSYCPILTDESEISITDPVISVTPNPSDGNFVLSYTGYNPTNVTIELRDISGRLLSSTAIRSVAEFRLPFGEGELSDGIYFLNVITPEETITRKVVVQH